MTHYKRSIGAFFLLLYNMTQSVESSTMCWLRKYQANFYGVPFNTTLNCPMYFQWTVNDFCCYDKYDRFEENPSCCYSETYKLVVAFGFFCLILVASSCCIFCCWVYNLPHHILYLLTCHKFHLNNWLSRNKNGTYVDQSFYSGLPFWTRGAELQPYPLRPLPPRIFYPAPPSSLKFRWDMSHDQLPLFILASRQFTRNPYSARPTDRPTENNMFPALTSGTTNGTGDQSVANSRRSSVSSAQGDNTTSNSGTAYKENNSMKFQPAFRINVDETEAEAQLLQALKDIDLNPNSVPTAGSSSTDTTHNKNKKPNSHFLSVGSTKFSIQDETHRRSSTGSLTSLSKRSLGIVPSLYIQNNSRRHTVANVNPHVTMPRVRTPGVTGPAGAIGMETILETDLDEELEDEDLDLGKESCSHIEHELKKGASESRDKMYSTQVTSPGLDKASSTALVPFTPDLPGRVPLSANTDDEDSELEDMKIDGVSGKGSRTSVSAYGKKRAN